MLAYICIAFCVNFWEKVGAGSTTWVLGIKGFIIAVGEELKVKVVEDIEAFSVLNQLFLVL
jgi:hypothetical protein